jgi:hypothetical protein
VVLSIDLETQPGGVFEPVGPASLLGHGIDAPRARHRRRTVEDMPRSMRSFQPVVNGRQLVAVNR